MGYKKTNWKDRVIEKPNTYRSVENPDGTITLYPITGQVIEKGTAVSAANLNKIEDQLENFDSQLDNIEYINNDNYISLLDAKYKHLVTANDYTQVLKQIIEDIKPVICVKDKIKFPNFEIELKEEIVLPNDKVITLFGNGKNSIVKYNNSNIIESLFVKNDNKNLANGDYEGLKIHDLYIDCNELTNYAITIKQAKQTKIFNNFIKNFRMCGILLESSNTSITDTRVYETMIFNNYIRGGASNPMHCVKTGIGATDNQIYDNILVDCKESYVIDEGSYNQFYDNHTFSYPVSKSPNYSFIISPYSSCNFNYIDSPRNGILSKVGHSMIVGNKFLKHSDIDNTNDILIELQAKDGSSSYYNSIITNNKVINYSDNNTFKADIKCTLGSISLKDVEIDNNFPTRNMFIEKYYNEKNIDRLNVDEINIDKLATSTSVGAINENIYSLKTEKFSTALMKLKYFNKTSNEELGSVEFSPQASTIHNKKIVQLLANGVGLKVFSNGEVSPTGGLKSLGATGNRWTNLFLTNSPNVSSKRELKENIEIFNDEEAYNHIKDLNVYTYNYKKFDDNGNCIGVDAENMLGSLLDELPIECINEEAEGVDLYAYTSYCVSALKKAIEKIEVLEEEIKIIKSI